MTLNKQGLGIVQRLNTYMWYSAMNLPSVGLDISKSNFHAAILKTLDTKPLVKAFNNNESGFAELLSWLQSQGIHQSGVCLEATSTYGHSVARFLHQHDYRVSIVNPLRIKGFGQSQLSRTKNDRADAGLIARYGAMNAPSQWLPPSAQQAAMQQYERQWQAMGQMIEQERNRLETITEPGVIQVIQDHIDYIKTQQQHLLEQIESLMITDPILKTDLKLVQSIPGIGQQTALLLLAELGDVRAFGSARQIAAFAGLTPQEHSSGSSINGKPRLCKIGSSRLRFLLFMPALVALRFNPPIRAMRERLLAAGKAKMQIVGAAMHKLLRLVYGVISSGKPFDPEISDVSVTA